MIYTQEKKPQREDFYFPKETEITVGTVLDVDASRGLVTVRSTSSGSIIKDIPVMRSYYQSLGGYGTYVVPEIDSKVVMARTIDTYFVIGFLPRVNRDATFAATQENGRIQTTNETAINDRLKDVFPEKSANRTSKSSSRSRKVSYNNTDEDLQPGDSISKTKAGNKSIVYASGDILHYANAVCQRVFSVLKNTIADICINYKLITPGMTDMVTNDADHVDHESTYRNLVTDKRPTFIRQIGTKVNFYAERMQDPSQAESAADPVHGKRTYERQIAKDGHFKERVESGGIKKYDHEYDPAGTHSQYVSGTSRMDVFGELRGEHVSGTRHVSAILHEISVNPIKFVPYEPPPDGPAAPGTIIPIDAAAYDVSIRAKSMGIGTTGPLTLGSEIPGSGLPIVRAFVDIIIVNGPFGPCVGFAVTGSPIAQAI